MAAPDGTDMRTLDDVLMQIGNKTRFHLLVILLGKLPVLLVAWTMIEMSFVAAQPDWCCVPKHVNQTATNFCHSDNATFGTNCHDSGDTDCSHRVFEDGMNTIVNEWDLVCDKKWKASLSTSLQMAGVLVGALIGGFMTDMLGRKKTFYISTSTVAAFSLISGFSTSWEMFTTFRVLLGLSCGIYLVVNVPYIMEFLSPARRDLAAVLPLYPFGSILMTLVAWQLHDWRWIHWLCAAGMFPLLFGWFILPESLRWLTIKGKLDKADKVVADIAHMNGRVVPEGHRQVLEAVYEQELKAEGSGRRHYTYLDIYRGWKMFKVSVILQVIWFSFSFCGYGILFGASTLGLNLYLNLFLMSAVLVPIIMLMIPILTRIGRKTVIVSLLSISSLCGFACVIVYEKVSDADTRDLVTNILCLTANALLGGAWTAIMVVNNELYPTVLRSMGYAATNTWSRVGGILAPFAFDFKSMPVLAYAFIGGFMALCTVLVLFLQETHGLSLQDTLAGEQEVVVAGGSKAHKFDDDDSKTPLLSHDIDDKKYYGLSCNQSFPEDC